LFENVNADKFLKIGLTTCRKGVLTRQGIEKKSTNAAGLPM